MDQIPVLPLCSIFDRAQSKTHPWIKVFGTSPEPTPPSSFTPLSRMVIRNNWRMDHRVDKNREEEILMNKAFKDSPSNLDDWSGQCREYFRHELCLPSHRGPTSLPSAYCRDENSQNNIDIQQNRIPRFDQLFHVKSFNRLIQRLNSGNNTLTELTKVKFHQITGEAFPAKQPNISGTSNIDDLAQKLNNKGAGTIKELAGFLVKAMGERQPPWWAGFAQEIMPIYKNKDWPEICQVFGLGHLDQGDWLLFWRYEVREVDFLHRPTVIEANDSPYHFPSPPGYPFGITMPLKQGHKGSLREMIHAPLSPEMASKTSTGDLVQLGSSPISDPGGLLPKLRKEHIARIKKEARQEGTNTKIWFDNHSRWI